MGEVFKADNYDDITTDEQRARDVATAEHLEKVNSAEAETVNKVVTPAEIKDVPSTTAAAETKG